MIVLVTLTFAQRSSPRAVLCYLGLGPPPPTPTWGRMLSEGRDLLPDRAVAHARARHRDRDTVVGFNLLGEGLRDCLDPKERR